MADRTYKSILTELRNDLEDLRSAFNDIDLDGNQNMNTWASQLLNLGNSVAEVKEALEEIGIDTSQDVSTWPSQIEGITTQIEVLQQTVETLNNLANELTGQITTDNGQFDDIYDAIVEKGQSPDHDDRDTYAPAILAISGGGGGDSEDYEINYAYNLFGADVSSTAGNRANVIDYLLPHCKNVYNWNHAFYGCKIPNGKKVTVKIDSGLTNAESSNVFKEAYPENNNAEITLRVESVGICRYAFNECNKNYGYGYVNCELKDTGNNNINLNKMFYYAKGIKSISIDIGEERKFDASQMFYYFNTSGKGTTEIDLGLIGLNVENATSLESCFEGCNKLTSIKLKSSPVSINNISISSFCTGCTALSSFETEVELVNVKSSFMFYNCGNITELHIDIKQTVSNKSCTSMFNKCSKLEQIESNDNWQFRDSTESIFDGCSVLVSVPNIELYYAYSTISYAFRNCYNIEYITIYVYGRLKYCSNAFYGCSSLKGILGNFDMSYVNSISNMFYGCVSLETIECTGSFGGSESSSTMTLDLSASPVFHISEFLESLAANGSGKTRIIKLHSTVYGGLTDDDISVAASKNYTLSQ